LIKSNANSFEVLSVYRTFKGISILKGSKVIHFIDGIDGWNIKWNELESQGYIMEDRARLYDLLPSDWNLQKSKMERDFLYLHPKERVIQTLSSFKNRIVKYGFFIGLALFIMTLFVKDRYPSKEEMRKELYKEPVQTKVALQPFIKEVGGYSYVIEPVYSYELYGMVVTFHHTQTWWDMYHKDWGDVINIKDLCVIWGENLSSEVYQKMKFSSGSWTCYASFKRGSRQKDWVKFKGHALSNNHLLAKNKKINKAIMATERGDQIYMKGYLANYGRKDSGGRRRSSLTRTDTGNGACETVYVTDFRILKKANPFLRNVNRISKYVFILCALLAIVFMFTDPIRKI